MSDTLHSYTVVVIQLTRERVTRSLIMKKLIVALSLASIIGTTAAWAHTDAMGIVKERMDLMKELKTAMKNLKPLVRDPNKNTHSSIKQHAFVLEKNAGEQMTVLFPKGSLDKPTETSVEIWNQWDEFLILANNQKQLAQELILEVDTNANAKTITKIFRDIADNCSNCHEKFKVE